MIRTERLYVENVLKKNIQNFSSDDMKKEIKRIRKMIREEIEREFERKFWERLQIIFGILIILNVTLVPPVLDFLGRTDCYGYWFGALSTFILLMVYLYFEDKSAEYEKALQDKYQTLIPRILEFRIDGIEYKFELKSAEVNPNLNEVVLKYRLVEE